MKRLKTKKPLTDKVYRQVYLDIINGEILPDEFITESQLIERFGVSKSPVREALIMLCNENVLECIPRRGYRVVLICRDELKQIVETRQVLELFMFERAFPRLTRQDLNRLRELNDKARDAAQMTTMQRWEHNIAFHLGLASYAGNQYMLKILADTLRVNARASTLYFNYVKLHNAQAERDLHHRLINACEERDYEKAVELLKSDTRELLIREVGYR